MDAIPSLCACSATCGAATIGCAYGRLDSAATPVGGGLYGHNEAPTSPPTLPDIPVDRLSIRPSPASHRRPQSVSVTPSGQFWGGLLEEQSPSGPEKPNYDHGLRTSAIFEDTKTPSKPSWVRRVSTIAQSRDGTRPSSPRPQSPLPSANRSNALFSSNSSPVTPRNKLVKRSTSLRILHSGPFDSSPLSASQTPTFRRPVTSHQRSEQFRLQQLQRGFENLNTTSDSPEPTNEQLSTPARPQESKGRTSLDPARSTWHPYFLVQSIRLIRDISVRSTSTSKGPIETESVPCIRTLPGTVPALVPASRLTKSSLQGNSARFTLLKGFPDETDVAHSDNEPSVTRAQRPPRSRHSFSFGDILATPPSARKLRRGNSSRKLRGPETTPGRRVISAPQRDFQPAALQGDEAEPRKFEALAATGEESVLPKNTRKQSPLPPLKRLSAFQIDLLASDPAEPPSPNAQNSSSPLPTVSGSGDPIDRLGYSSIRFKPRRTSRIPSDRASTVFSSENGHSRVFSADGDDIDYRSETVYDSIRTDATSSSHSGAKVHRADSVFTGATSPEPTSILNVPTSDRFGQNVVGSSKVHDIRISEEEELMRTPVRSTYSQDAETPTPAPRSFPLAAPSRPPPVISRPESGTIDTLPEEDTDADEFWSVHEENMEWADSAPPADDADFEGIWADMPTPHEDLLRRRESPNRGDQLLSSIEQPENAQTEQTRSAMAYFTTERGSRAAGRRAPMGLHLRSQSVPLSPENSNHRFNNAARLDAWILGGGGVSEDWDGDFVFDEPSHSGPIEDSQSTNTERLTEPTGVLVPPSILERQASVHGQFGQVKEFTLLVEDLRRLRLAASVHGLLQGQSSELWREAEGIIDLATVDGDDLHPEPPHSPHSSSFDFDAFDEEQPTLPRPHNMIQAASDTIRPPNDGSFLSDSAGMSSSPLTSLHSTPQTRPRRESAAKAKHVLENIHQHRNIRDTLPVDEETSPRKLPFDTTSLRDLVTRAGVVTRALREIVRRAEESEGTSGEHERRSQTPPDPPFSQIFHQPPTTPPSSRRSPRSGRRRNSGSFLSGSSPPNEGDRNGHMSIMSVV